MSGSGLRRHDPRHRLIAPSPRRETPLPASHRCRPGACEGACDALGHAKNTPSTADAATTSRSRSSVQRLLPPPMQPPREPPPRQIPIDRRPLTQPPRVPSLKAFRRRPSTPVDRPRRAAIRNPAQLRKVMIFCPSSALRAESGRFGASGYARRVLQKRKAARRAQILRSVGTPSRVRRGRD